MWVKLDDTFGDHPKIAGLTDGAYRLYVNALCWSAKHLTDGHVPVGMLVQLRGTRRLARELVATALWDVDLDGWVICNYLRYQPSAAERTATLAKRTSARSDAGVLGNHVRHHAAKGETNPDCPHCDSQTGRKPLANEVANSVANVSQTDHPVPVPVPNSTSSSTQPGSDPPSDEDDTDPIWQLWAMRRLDATRAAGVHVAAPERWLASVRTSLRAEHRTEVAAIRAATTIDDPRQIMDRIEHGLDIRIDCDTCNNRGVVELDDGLVRACDCMRTP